MLSEQSAALALVTALYFQGNISTTEQNNFLIRKRLIMSDKGGLEWKNMYFKLCRCYPHREQYSDTLHFCTHCHILFWKDTNHPCTANNPESCTISISPQEFINLFKF